MGVHNSDVGSPVGFTIEPIVEVMYNFTGETLLEGDVVVGDFWGRSSGVSYSAQWGSATHPFSRVVDISSTSTVGALESMNIGPHYVYIGTTSLPNTQKGLFMRQGYHTKVRTITTAAQVAAAPTTPYVYVIAATPTDKTLEALLGPTERILFWAERQATVADAAHLIPGLFLGDFAGGFGRSHA